MTSEQLLAFDPKPGTCLIRCQENAAKSAGGLIVYADKYRPWQPIGEVVRIGKTDRDPGFAVGERVLFSRPDCEHFETTDGDTFALSSLEGVMCVYEAD